MRTGDVITFMNGVPCTDHARCCRVDIGRTEDRRDRGGGDTWWGRGASTACVIGACECVHHRLMRCWCAASGEGALARQVVQPP